MKKEYLALAILGLFILGYVLDYVAGPVNITLINPLQFTDSEVLAKYPFTATSIIIKTIGLFGTVLLIFSFVVKKWLLKSVTMLFIVALFELYAIQQLATGTMVVPIQWALTFSLTGIVLLLPTVVYFILGIFSSVFDKTLAKKKQVPESPSVSPQEQS